jgi:hypothetical protein
MKYPVTLQFAVLDNKQTFWLYERKVELPCPPFPNLLLTGYAPNVTGPNSTFDNVVQAVVVKEGSDEVFVKVQGFTDLSRSAEEVDALVPGWTRNPKPLRVAGQKLSDDDKMNQLFN